MRSICSYLFSKLLHIAGTATTSFRLLSADLLGPRPLTTLCDGYYLAVYLYIYL